MGNESTFESIFYLVPDTIQIMIEDNSYSINRVKFKLMSLQEFTTGIRAKFEGRWEDIFNKKYDKLFKRHDQIKKTGGNNLKFM